MLYLTIPDGSTFGTCVIRSATTDMVGRSATYSISDLGPIDGRITYRYAGEDEEKVTSAVNVYQAGGGLVRIVCDDPDDPDVHQVSKWMARGGACHGHWSDFLDWIERIPAPPDPALANDYRYSR